MATDGILSCQLPERQFPVLLVRAGGCILSELPAEQSIRQRVVHPDLDHAMERASDGLFGFFVLDTDKGYGWRMLCH